MCLSCSELHSVSAAAVTATTSLGTPGQQSVILPHCFSNGVILCKSINVETLEHHPGLNTQEVLIEQYGHFGGCTL